MEEEGVISSGVLDKPMHGTQDIGLCGLAHGVLLVVCEDDHVLSSVAVALVQVVGHVLDVVDASSQLSALVEVVDSDQQGLALAGAVGVLEVVSLGGSMAEGDGVVGRRRGTLAIRILVV